MQINCKTIDFLRLTITAKEYQNFIMNDFSIIGELNSLLPKNKDINSDEWASYDCAKSLEANNFDIFKVIELYGGFDSAMGRSTAYRLIYTVVSQYEKNIEFSSYYKDQFLFYVDALPSYIGGREVDKFIDDIFKNIPKNNNVFFIIIYSLSLIIVYMIDMTMPSIQRLNFRIYYIDHMVNTLISSG